MNWVRHFVTMLVLFAISANLTVAFTHSFESVLAQQNVDKLSDRAKLQQRNDNLLFFFEEDFLEEVEEEFDPLDELPTYECTSIGTPVYLLRFHAAHRQKKEAYLEQLVNVYKNPLFIVYQVFRI